MSNLVEYAKSELALAFGAEPGDWYSEMVRAAIIELIEKFADQGHSGFSAGMVAGAVEKLIRFEPLTPLTGEDAEWTEVYDGCFQNRRCPHVFKEDGEAYDSEGRIFEDPDGSRFIGRDSRVPVTFPYVPSREIVKREAHGVSP